MARKMFSTGLVLAFTGMCLCQQQSTSSSPSQYQSAAVSQMSFQTGSAVQQPQTKLEDIERDNLVAAFGQKTQQQSNKPSSSTPSVSQQQQQQPPQSYQTIPQQQYFVQPYQGLQQQFFMQPYQTQQHQYFAQPYQMAFDYNGVQYSIVSPNSYPGNQFYQQYYVPAAQPSAVPQYVTKQSSPAAAPAQAQQEYKQQQFPAPAPAQAQQVYKQQQFSAPVQAQQVYKPQQFATPVQVQQEYKQQFAAPTQAQQEYKQQQFNALAQAQKEYKQQQQQYVVPSPAYQYVLQPAAPAANGPADYSYVTRHPATTTAQFKAPTATAAVQPQFQYNVLPQQYQQQQQQQQQQPQYYYTVAATEQPQVQQSAKSQFSSGVKSTTPTPLAKEQFAYKFESSPQQQPGAAYSTLRYSA